LDETMTNIAVSPGAPPAHKHVVAGEAQPTKLQALLNDRLLLSAFSDSSL
jgi:hypothetical protein